MTDPTPSLPLDPTDGSADDPTPSPVDGRADVPVPRLTTPAAEPADESREAERGAVGDVPDTGGLTPPDDAW